MPSYVQADLWLQYLPPPRDLSLEQEDKDSPLHLGLGGPLAVSSSPHQNRSCARTAPPRGTSADMDLQSTSLPSSVALQPSPIYLIKGLAACEPATWIH